MINLTWEGKDQIKNDYISNKKLLKINDITSDNMLIKGDNIDALYLLQEKYNNKIKMIYIDPPYNTGNNFVYKDKFKKHSNWLNFMYPRLFLARKLLKDDGVIFISIDDNEVAQLKLICDEIFGEENFISLMPRLIKKSGIATKGISKNHDYILIYKNKNIQLNNPSLINTTFSLKDEYFDSRGFYKLHLPLDCNSLAYSKNLDYEIILDGKYFYPGGIKNYLKRKDGQINKIDWAWRWSKEKFEFGLKNGFIVIKNNRLYTKTYFNANISKTKPYKIDFIKRIKNIQSIDLVENQYSNVNGFKNLEKLLNNRMFDYAKPVELIKFLLQISTNENDIILDFFAGSGTTAHAVMQLNAEDNKNRKFILVQIDEPIDEQKSKIAYDFVKNELKCEPTIYEITKERIIRAANKIKQNCSNDINLEFSEYEVI